MAVAFYLFHSHGSGLWRSPRPPPEPPPWWSSITRVNDVYARSSLYTTTSGDLNLNQQQQQQQQQQQHFVPSWLKLSAAGTKTFKFDRSTFWGAWGNILKVLLTRNYLNNIYLSNLLIVHFLLNSLVMILAYQILFLNYSSSRHFSWSRRYRDIKLYVNKADSHKSRVKWFRTDGRMDGRTDGRT